MQVWKIKAVTKDNQILSSSQAIIRFLLATISWVPLGAGFFWMLNSKERLTFYDQHSHSRIVYLGSKPYASERQYKIDRRDEEV